MKKLLIMAAIAAFGFTSVQAQEGGIKLGINFGLPVGDEFFKNYSSFNLSVDAAYLITVADSFQVGPTIGYSHFFAKEYEFLGANVKGDDIQFIPIAGSARFDLDGLFFGADLGYAVGVNDGNDGGFYYKPKIGYNLGPASLIFSYSGISLDDGSISSLNLGVEFGF